MEWSLLFSMQQKLDQYIEENHQLEDENLFHDKYLALLVELGELANETRCFKFWSIKYDTNEQAILEEFVDVLHFILSLGIEKSLVIDLSEIEPPNTSMTEQFTLIYESCVLFKRESTMQNYEQLFYRYLQLGNLLGLFPEKIRQAYIEKNEVNYERQDEGY